MLSPDFIEEIRGINKVLNISCEGKLLVFEIECRVGVVKLIASIEGIAVNELPAVVLVSDIGAYPHIYESKDGFKWVCYYDKGDIKVYDLTLEEKVKYMIKTLKSLFNLYPFQVIEEFQREFLVLWDNKSTLKSISYISPTNFVKKVSTYNNMENGQLMFKDTGDKSLVIEDKLTKQRDAIYIPTKGLEEDILPPNATEWNSRYLLDFLERCLSRQVLEELEKTKLKRSTSLILSIPFTDGITILAGVSIKFDDRKSRNLFEKIKRSKEIELMRVERRDSLYLQERVGNTTENLSKKVLIVGVGSLGSQLCEEMLKNGYDDFTLVDSDKFEMGNTARHTLFEFHCERNKAEALGALLKLKFPQVKFRSVDKKIEGSNLNLNKYNIIVFAVGSTDIQRYYNKKLKEMSYEGIAIYSWLEAGGERSHAVRVEYSSSGCYECLFDNNGDNVLDGETGVDMLTISNMCGGTFAPYGNTSILKAIILIMEQLKYQVKENSSLSWIGNGMERKELCRDNKGCGICGEEVSDIQR